MARDNRVRRIEKREMKGLARFPTTGKGGLGLALYNVLSWRRGGLVRMPEAGLPAGEFELIDPATGGSVLYHRRRKGIEFIAPPVPAAGYLVLEVRPVRHRRQPGAEAAWDERRLTLHFEGYSLQFHHAGGLARWHDRDRSTQWCSHQASYPLGACLCEKMSRCRPLAGCEASIQPEMTPLYARVTVEADGPANKVPQRRTSNVRRYRTTFTVYRCNRDLHVSIRPLGHRATSAVKAGYGFFPFAPEKPRVLVRRIAEPVELHQHPLADIDAARVVIPYGIRIQGAHAGVNFYSLNTSLVAFGEPEAYCSSDDDDGKYTTGILYATLFDNDRRMSTVRGSSGRSSFDFTIRPTGNDQRDGGLAKAGAEVFRPLIAKVTAGFKGNTPARSCRSSRTAFASSP